MALDCQFPGLPFCDTCSLSCRPYQWQSVNAGLTRSWVMYLHAILQLRSVMHISFCIMFCSSTNCCDKDCVLGVWPYCGHFQTLDNFGHWLDWEFSHLASNCQSRMIQSFPSFRVVIPSFRIRVEMQKLWEVKLKVIFLFKWSLRPSQLCLRLSL